MAHTAFIPRVPCTSMAAAARRRTLQKNAPRSLSLAGATGVPRRNPQPTPGCV